MTGLISNAVSELKRAAYKHCVDNDIPALFFGNINDVRENIKRYGEDIVYDVLDGDKYIGFTVTDKNGYIFLINKLSCERVLLTDSCTYYFQEVSVGKNHELILYRESGTVKLNGRILSNVRKKKHAKQLRVLFEILNVTYATDATFALRSNRTGIKLQVPYWDIVKVIAAKMHNPELPGYLSRRNSTELKYDYLNHWDPTKC